MANYKLDAMFEIRKLANCPAACPSPCPRSVKNPDFIKEVPKPELIAAPTAPARPTLKSKPRLTKEAGAKAGASPAAIAVAKAIDIEGEKDLRDSKRSAPASPNGLRMPTITLLRPFLKALAGSSKISPIVALISLEYRLLDSNVIVGVKAVEATKVVVDTVVF